MPKPQKRLPPIHAGEILRTEFMEPLQLSMNRLALDLHDDQPGENQEGHGLNGC
ncbi:MAG: hypothetical protein ACLP6G_20665 [Terriglobales bacterium]